MTLSELGMYRGSTKYLRLEIRDKDGDMVTIDVSRLSLTIYRPDGSIMTTYTSGFDPQPDGSVIRGLTIPSNEPTGIWRAVWNYTDAGGNTFVEETVFVVSNPER
jgi:uncharacterized protein YfaS (alpha-2-macroglobulin family)